MKRILLAVLMLTMVFPAFRKAAADVGVSVNFFYDNIESDGSWVEVDDYGYCWQPAVAVSNARWRPYWDGYWAYTDAGWTWISYEDFGWATYHYGRWVRLRDRGWYWVPGREWAPAWVSWRTGGDYVGWAPLPPRTADEFIDEGSPITSHVDVAFDIGPAYYNFVDVRYIGEPVLRERIYEPAQNVTYITNTVNVTNITYSNSMVHTGGPDYNTLSQYSTRPIRRMTLERETSVDPNAAAKSKTITKVEGDKFVVAAPLTLQKASAPVAPKTVKEKIAKPVIEKGWDHVSDPKMQAELKQKIKGEDPKNVPPPSSKPGEKAAQTLAPSASSAPIAPTSPAGLAKPPGSPQAAPSRPMATAPAAATPASTQGKGKDKPAKDHSPAPAASAPLNPSTAPASTAPGKGKKDRFVKPTPGLEPPANAAGNTPDSRQGKSNDRRQTPSNLTTSPDGTPFKESPQHDEAKKDKHPGKAPDMMPPTRQPEPVEKAPKKRFEAPTAPPNRPPSADNMPRQPSAPERAPQPNRGAPEAPRKHPPGPQQMAPAAPNPGGSGPAKQEAPNAKQGHEKKGGQQPAASPGPGQ